MFQSFNLTGSRTHWRTWRCRSTCGVPGRSVRKALELLERMGLKEWAHHLPNRLSGGRNRSVAHRPALIMTLVIPADEPTGALDSTTSHDVMDLLLEREPRPGAHRGDRDARARHRRHDQPVHHLKDGRIEAR